MASQSLPLLFYGGGGGHLINNFGFREIDVQVTLLFQNPDQSSGRHDWRGTFWTRLRKSVSSPEVSPRWRTQQQQNGSRRQEDFSSRESSPEPQISITTNCSFDAFL
jgi:hypothetical protein